MRFGSPALVLIMFRNGVEGGEGGDGGGGDGETFD